MNKYNAGGIAPHAADLEIRCGWMMTVLTCYQSRKETVVDSVLNVVAHAQKPDFVFRRNGRVYLNRLERHFSPLLAAEVCTSGVVMLDTPCFEVVWRVLATHSICQFPIHFPTRASPCVITFHLPPDLEAAWAWETIYTQWEKKETASLPALESRVFCKSDRTLIITSRVAVLKRMREALRRKRSQLWMNQNWVLHHVNAPAHSSFLVRNFLTKNKTTVVPQPPYSPDLAPADFFLFPKLKSTLKGCRFDTFDEIQKNSTKELSAIQKETFQSWQKH